jgi:tRNA-2-methylthio-N6-dimethylallyladenosine synthase
LSIIERLRHKKPNIKFSSDFIIGYPNETEQDFADTINLLERVKFINSYSFIFSARPGTPSNRLSLVEKEIAKKRLKIFQELSDEIKKNYRKNLLNTETNVLFENKLEQKDRYFGRDEFSNSIIVDSQVNLTGRIMNTKINSFNSNTLFGEIVKEKEFAA